MQLTISKHALTQALYKAQGVADRKSATNILSHVLVESTSPSQVRFTCTDHDVTLTGTYPAEVTVPGRLAINAKSMFEVVRTLPDQPIRLNGLDNHWVEVQCASSRFKLAGLPPDDFPELQPPQGLKPFRVPKRLFLSLVDRTDFSVSHDETRPSLNGVFFRVVREDAEVRMTMVSTDGHRLSRAEALGGDADETPSKQEAILHHKALSDLKRTIEGDDEDVRIAFHRGNVLFTNDEVTLLVRQLDETFPDYTKVIPQSSAARLTLSRAALQSAIKRIATLTTSKTNIIRFEVDSGRLVLSTQNPEMGEGRDELVIGDDAPALAVGFNYKYLLDVLGVVSGEDVNFALSDQYSPGIITSPDDDGSLFVIMPMRI